MNYYYIQLYDVEHFAYIMWLQLDKQFQDFTDVSTSVLFELILIAHQVSCTILPIN